jgi:CheY-like chemotaxis protein
MQLRCVIVDDSPDFLRTARVVLGSEGIDVVGLASTGAEALEHVAALRPDVVLVDVGLGEESGFEVVRRLAAEIDPPPVSTILISTRDAEELIDLVAVTPVLGFLSKADLTAAAVRDLLADRAHGEGCRHEALVYSTPEELVAGTAPFVRNGLAAGESVLAVMRPAAWTTLREALGDEAVSVAFVDADEWHRDGAYTSEAFVRYVEDRLASGARRVRIIDQPTWHTTSPAAVAERKRFEAEVSVDMASLPVSFLCPYDAQELPDDIVADALRTHPLVRNGHGTLPSPSYTEPGAFVRELERQVPELARTRSPGGSESSAPESSAGGE